MDKGDPSGEIAWVDKPMTFVLPRSISLRFRLPQGSGATEEFVFFAFGEDQAEAPGFAGAVGAPIFRRKAHLLWS